MLYLTCTTITSVDLAHYGVSRAKDWVSVDCGTIHINDRGQQGGCIVQDFNDSIISAQTYFKFRRMHLNSYINMGQ